MDKLLDNTPIPFHNDPYINTAANVALNTILAENGMTRKDIPLALHNAAWGFAEGTVDIVKGGLGAIGNGVLAIGSGVKDGAIYAIDKL